MNDRKTLMNDLIKAVDELVEFEQARWDIEDLGDLEGNGQTVTSVYVHDIDGGELMELVARSQII